MRQNVAFDQGQHCCLQYSNFCKLNTTHKTNPLHSKWICPMDLSKDIFGILAYSVDQDQMPKMQCHCLFKVQELFADLQ